MFLIRLFICIDFIFSPVTPGQGYSNLHKKTIIIGEASGQHYFSQRGQSYLAKRDNSAWPKGAKLSGFSTLYYLYNQNQFSSHNNYGELKMLKKKEASVSGRLSFLFG